MAFFVTFFSNLYEIFLNNFPLEETIALIKFKAEINRAGNCRAQNFQVLLLSHTVGSNPGTKIVKFKPVMFVTYAQYFSRNYLRLTFFQKQFLKTFTFDLSSL